MDGLSKHLWDTATAMNRMTSLAPQPMRVDVVGRDVYLLWLNESVLAIYASPERAAVEAHLIRQGPELRDRSWEKVIDQPGKQRWACDVVARLEIETRRIG